MGYFEYIILYFCALIIGVTKAGFGGGTGLIVTPLLASIMPAKEAVGMMLPLLLATDIFSLFHYWGKWDKRNVLGLLPGALMGIFIGTVLLGVMTDFYLKKAIGVIACVFALVQFFRSYILRKDSVFSAKYWHGIIAGAAAGTVSTLAHIGGVITSMYLLPQKLPNQTYVGTTTATYFLINTSKIVPYLYLTIFTANKMFTANNLKYDAMLIPMILVGVIVGIFLNKRISSALFSKIILILVLAVGLKLLGFFSLVSILFQWMVG